MNKIIWVAILEGITTAIFLIIPAVSDLSWWWFFLPLISIISIDLIVGLIVIMVNISKRKKPEVMKINIKDAKKRAVYEMKMDEDNPDNFKITFQKVINVGERGSEKTKVLLLEGYGTELNERRVVIINMNNPKQEQTKLIDPSTDEVIYYAKLIADNPPEEEIKEQTTTGIDAFGRPTTTTTRISPSSVESIKKAEEEKAEKENAM